MEEPPPNPHPAPLRTAIASENNDHRLVHLDDGSLALVPRYDARNILLGSLVFAALGAAAWAICRLIGVAAVASTIVAGIFGAAAVAWAALLTLLVPFWTRVTFDANRRLIRASGVRFAGRPTFPVETLAAVQLCGPISHSDWHSYQLNLAFQPNTESGRRLNLLDNGDRIALTRMGREIAVFLNVPFVDQSS